MVNASFQLVAGCKQLLPGDAVALIAGSPVRNMGADGNTAGRDVSTIDMEDLRAWRPGWSSDPVSAVVRHVMADPDDPRRYYNWPPSDGTNYLELKYAQVPDNVSVTVNNTTIGAAAGASVVPMASTVGIKVGQSLSDLTKFFVRGPAQPVFVTAPGTTVLSIQTNISVTLSAPLVAAIMAADWLSFSDAFPLPDLYEEPVYQFMMAHALQKNTTKGDPALANSYWQTFMALIGADDATIEKLNIGRPDS